MFSSKNRSNGIPWKLLSLETVLIILSVLLALWLNQWNENRSNQELSVRALQSIIDEAADNCSKIQNLQPYHQAVFSGEKEYEGLGDVFIRNDAWNSAQTAGTVHNMEYRVAAKAGMVHALQNDHRRLVETGIQAVYITATNEDQTLEKFQEMIMNNNSDWLRGPHPMMLADLIRIQNNLFDAYTELFRISNEIYGDAIAVTDQCSK